MNLNLEFPPGTQRIDLAFEKFHNVWNCWSLIDMYWFRGKGPDPQSACAAMLDAYIRGLHLGKIKQIEHIMRDKTQDGRTREGKLLKRIAEADEKETESLKDIF